MGGSNAVEGGRAAFAQGAWPDAYAQLSAADGTAPLAPEDLERLAQAAFLVGKDDDRSDLLARAHRAHLEADDAVGAARCAFWLGFALFNRGEMAQGSGWMGRAARLLEDGHHDCVEQGYLLIPAGLGLLGGGDAAGAGATFDRATEVGERFADPDLTALGRLGKGQSLVVLGETTQGMALLDEAMVAVTFGEVSPAVAGLIYCAVVETCQEAVDLRRAQEWTAALSDWCDAQPGLAPYRGQCLVHRSEIMQLHGDWTAAEAEARQACQRLAGHPAEGAAHYRRAELLRLRGDLAAAEDAYQEASRLGKRPEPGLALLRLAQGRLDAAQAAVARATDATAVPAARSRLLTATVDIALAAGDQAAGRAAADELSALAADIKAPALEAMAAQAQGAVVLAEGDAEAACQALRRAQSLWRGLDAPYEEARVRVLLARACRGLGDEDGATLELDAARSDFLRLGATADLTRLEEMGRRAHTPRPGGLTDRETEVLRLVATGTTNRALAAELFISEKTVARHVANIFTKLGVSSRSAATAFAYENDLA